MYLTQGLHRAVQQDADRPATVSGDRVRTFAESADRVARLAAGLRALGVRSGDRVGIVSLNSDRFHEFLLAVPWADGVVVPLNLRWSAAEIAHALDHSGVRVLFVDDLLVPLLPRIAELYDGLTRIVYAGDGSCPDDLVDYEGLVAGHDPVDDVRRGGDELFGIFYTGGTTGRPKGVMLTHHNLLTSAWGTLATGHFVSRPGRLLHAAPMFHLADIAAWTAGLLVGSVQVIIAAFTPERTLDAVERHRVTDVLLVPTMIQLLVDQPGLEQRDLSSVTHLTYGASPMSETLLERARKAFPRAGFTQAYGMTELAPVAALLLPADHDDPSLRRSAGRAAPHAEIRVVDGDGVELPRGTVGEIVVRGDHLTPGYWRDPEETAKAIRDGWMFTGDGGFMDDRGYVFVVDRIKDMIVSGGENVYSAEVENVLARHPALAACAVVGVPDSRWGERVHAVVVLRPGGAVTAAELTEFCRGHIAAYKAPRSVEIVEALPMSAAGKVLKRELRDHYWAGHDRQVR